MPKYKRIGLAPAPTLDADSNQTLFSQENFRRWDFTGPGTFAIASGVIHRFLLPANCRRHWFWIAAGAHLHVSNLDYWFVQGCLNFTRAGRPVGCVLFGDADQQSAGYAPQRDAAKRLVLRTSPDGNGSVQPSIRFQEFNGSAVRANLDIGAIEIPVLADAVDYDVEASRVEINSGAAVRILTGCRILSVP
jgi:hypothetical protein